MPFNEPCVEATGEVGFLLARLGREAILIKRGGPCVSFALSSEQILCNNSEHVAKVTVGL